MIERLRVEIHDILIPPLVLGMTTLAFGHLVLVQPAVKSRVLFNILSHIAVIVTGEASPHLIGLLQGLMTAFAFLLELGMTGDHRPGHQQQIELAREYRRSRTKHQQEQIEDKAAISNHRKQRNAC